MVVPGIVFSLVLPTLRMCTYVWNMTYRLPHILMLAKIVKESALHLHKNAVPTCLPSDIPILTLCEKQEKVFTVAFFFLHYKLC